MTIYIGNIPYTMKEQNLIDVFQEFGPVESAKVIIDKKTKRSKGYGFVEMHNEADELTAIEALNSQDLGGRKVKVSRANPKKEAV
ncbi:MAG: RNA-binding protein [Bacteroidota bacterium]|nr:RNA-binding protein [Bacteroidota bacterium]